MKRSQWFALGAFGLAVLALQVMYVQNGRIVPDAFEHMHAAYLVAHGQTPFRDFFEHHTPLFYFMMPLILGLKHPGFNTMIHAKWVSLGFHLLTLLVVFGWIRKLAGTAVATITTVLLAGSSSFFLWGVHTYLDTYAAPFVILSAWLLPVRRGHRTGAFLSAFCIGIAVLFTQKAVFAGLPAAAVFLLRGVRELRVPGERRAWLADLSMYVLGGVLAALALPVLLGPAGFRAFVQDAVVLNMHWKARHSGLPSLTTMFSLDTLFCVVAAISIAVGLVRLARRRWVPVEQDIPALYLLAMCAGIVLLPVVWEEYFVEFIPITAAAAGPIFVDWWRALRSPETYAMKVRHLAIARGVSVLLMAACTVYGVWWAIGGGSKLALATLAGAGLAWVVGGILLLWLRRSHSNWRDTWEGLVWLALVLVAPMLGQFRIAWNASNSDQRARVDYVMRVTSPSDPVFDGYSGYGVFRPHAYWYWFLHNEIQLMLTPKELGPDIIDALQRQKVKIVILDRYSRMLPASVLQYIHSHYEDTPFPDIKRRLPDLTGSGGSG